MRQIAANGLRGDAASQVLRLVIQQLHRKGAQLYALVVKMGALFQLGKATRFLRIRRVNKRYNFKNKTLSPFFLLVLTLFSGCTVMCRLGFGGGTTPCVGGLQLDSVEALEICDVFMEANMS